MASKNRKLGMGVQSLEAKTMMAGDAAVAFSGGDLIINEAANSIGENQYVQVSQLADGRVQVDGIKGTNLNYTPSRGDVRGRGQSVEVVDHNTIILSGVQDLDVSLGQGNDLFQTGVGTLQLNDIDIDMGVGNDADTVRLRKIDASGLINVETGGGADYLYMYKVNQTAVDAVFTDELNIDMGDGLDRVYMFRNSFSGDVAIDMSANDSLNERDEVEIVVSEMDDLDIDLGGGNDEVVLRFATLDDADIQGDNGNDHMYAEGVTADNVDFNGNAGVDAFFTSYYGSGGGFDNDINELNLVSAGFYD